MDTAESFAVRIKSNGARDTRGGKREKNKKRQKNYRRDKEEISLGGKRKKQINDKSLRAQSNEAVKQSSL